jgi:hypothetical protein
LVSPYQQNARHKITEGSISIRTFRREILKKTKEKMVRSIMKAEQAYCLNQEVKKKSKGSRIDTLGTPCFIVSQFEKKF